jgi:ketosteroid isomerase-like protein
LSRQNVELVRTALDAVTRRDWDAATAPYSPDIEWDDRDLRPEGGIHKGIDAMTKEMRTWFGTWENYWLRVDQALDAGDDVVVVLREGGMGRGSRVRMEQQIGMAMTVRDGLIERVRLYREPSKAFEAAGLTERQSETGPT